MARKRMIDPGIWASEDFGSLSTLAKLVFIGLFSNADDEGYGRAKPIYVKSILFPYDEDIRVADVDKTLKEIASKMSVTFFNGENGNRYYKLDNWLKWQVIQKPVPSKIKLSLIEDDYNTSTIPVQDEYNTSTRLVQDEYNTSTIPVQSNRIEKNKNKIEYSVCSNKSNIEYTIPTLEDIENYCKSNSFICSAEKFYNHYNSVGWKINNKHFNWQDRLKLWEIQDKEKNEKSNIMQKPKGSFNNYKQKIYSTEEINEILRRKGNV